MTLRRFAIFATLSLALATPAAAQGVLYECDLDTKRAMGWVSDKMALVFDGTGGVKVIDSVTLHYAEAPVPARVRKRGDVAKLTWTIAGARDSVGQVIPTLRYTAMLNLATNAISVLAKPASFPQRFSAKGSCQIRKNAKGFPRG